MPAYDTDRSTGKSDQVYDYKLPTSRTRNQAAADGRADGNSISRDEEGIFPMVGDPGKGLEPG